MSNLDQFKQKYKKTKFIRLNLTFSYILENQGVCLAAGCPGT